MVATMATVLSEYWPSGKRLAFDSRNCRVLTLAVAGANTKTPVLVHYPGVCYEKRKAAQGDYPTA